MWMEGETDPAEPPNWRLPPFLSSCCLGWSFFLVCWHLHPRESAGSEKSDTAFYISLSNQARKGFSGSNLGFNDPCYSGQAWTNVKESWWHACNMRRYMHTTGPGSRMRWSLKSKTVQREGWRGSQEEREGEREGGKEDLEHDRELHTNSAQEGQSELRRRMWSIFWSIHICTKENHNFHSRLI